VEERSDSAVRVIHEMHKKVEAYRRASATTDCVAFLRAAGDAVYT
jgi:hypothetical protein